MPNTQSSSNTKEKVSEPKFYNIVVHDNDNADSGFYYNLFEDIFDLGAFSSKRAIEMIERNGSVRVGDYLATPPKVYHYLKDIAEAISDTVIKFANHNNLTLKVEVVPEEV